MRKVIKLLIVGINKENGGIEMFFHNMVEELQKKNYEIDFISFYEKCAHEQYFIEHNCNIFHMTRRGENPLKSSRQLKQFFLNNKDYDYVWINQSSASNIQIQKATKKYSKAKVITHSHGINFESNNKIANMLHTCLHKYNQKKSISLTDIFFSCSRRAGTWLFGENVQFHVINNAIEEKKFKFNAEKRRHIRKELNIENDEICIGNVARLILMPKNQLFLLEIFKELLIDNDKMKLILIGDGPDRDEIEKEVSNLNLTSSVLLLGSKANANEYYNAMDIFLFPSIFEGLGMVLIEAQANGLQCFTSENIPLEASISDLFYSCSLEENAKTWADEIIKYQKSKLNRIDYIECLGKSGFTVEASCKMIDDILRSNSI